MPRTLSSGMQSHLASEHQTRCLMLRLDSVYGPSYGMTEHDVDIPFDLDVDSVGSLTYKSSLAIFPSQMELSLGFDADDVQFQGRLSSDFTRARIVNGYFADAVAYFFQVNWKDLTIGYIPLMKGFITDASLNDDEWSFTVSSQAAKLKQTRGRLITPYDDNPSPPDDTPVSATITSATDIRNIAVSFSGTYADNYFNRGTIAFTSGEMAGGRRIEIATWGNTGTIETWNRLPVLPQIGDTLELRRKYPRTIQEFIARFSDAEDFRGFPYLPGKDRFMKFPVPSAN